MATKNAKRRTKQPAKSKGTTRSTPERRGIDARWPWKEDPNPYFELRTSKIQGTGAFATRTIKRGTRIIEYLGQRISWRTAARSSDGDTSRVFCWSSARPQRASTGAPNATSQ